MKTGIMLDFISLVPSRDRMCGAYVMSDLQNNETNNLLQLSFFVKKTWPIFISITSKNQCKITNPFLQISQWRHLAAHNV